MMEGMKQTGIRWIGEIPSDWNTKRIKYMATLKGRIGWQGLTSEEYQDEGAYLITGVDFLDGGINWEQCEHVPMKRWEEAKDIQIQNGDLLITKDGTVGKVAIVSDMPGETSLNSGVLRIMPVKGYSGRFLYWVLQSEVFWNWFNFKNAGNSTIIHLYQGDFAEFIYAFPDYDEQERIAAYLNKECAKLDEIINGLLAQINLLKQFKENTIRDGVTKGIYGEQTIPVKMDYCSSVCRSWNLTKIKYFCKMFSGENLTAEDIDVDGDFPVYGGNGFRGYYNSYTNDGEHVLIGRQGALCGNVHIVSGKFWATDHAVVTYPTGDVDNRFLYYLFSAMNFNQYSMTAAQPGLAVSTIQNLKLYMPSSKKEQVAIREYLDTRCEEINSVLSVKETQLEVARKRKTSYIYEYVTGKKRVKEVM